MPLRRLWAALAAPLFLAFAAALPAAEAPKPNRPPDKLSDLHRFFGRALQKGLGAEVTAWPVRIQGRSWELLRNAYFPDVELSLRPFVAQGLRFEKAELRFRRMQLDRDSLLNWELEVRELREVETRLVFNLRSLAVKLSEQAGQEIRLRSVMDDQVLLLTGEGRLLGLRIPVEARCRPVWDEASKTLTLKPLEQRFRGRVLPRWLWWLAHSPVPKAPVLDLGFSWIPFNIQEVHVGWDHVNLSTNW